MLLFLRLHQLIVPELIVLGYILTLFGIGYLLTQTTSLYKLGISTISKVGLTYTIGTIILVYYLLVIGLYFKLTPVTVVALPSTLGVMGITFAIYHLFKHRPTINLTNWWKSILIFSTIHLIMVILLAFPDTGYDSNWFHLTQPLLYLKEGRIFHVGGQLYMSGYPQFIEILYLPLLSLGSSVLTSIFALYYFLGFGVLLYAIIYKITQSTKYALLGSLIILTLPTVIQFANLAYVDLPQAFYLALGILLLLSSSPRLKQVVLIAIALIPVATIKYAGGLLCAPLLIFAVIYWRKVIHLPSTRVIILSTILITIPILALLPWLYKNWLFTGYAFDPIGKLPISRFSNSYPNWIEFVVDQGRSIPHVFFDLRSGHFELLLPALAGISFVVTLLRRQWLPATLLCSTLLIWKILPPGNEFRYFIPLTTYLVVVFATLATKLKIKWPAVVVIATLIVYQLYPTAGWWLKYKDFAIGKETIQNFKRDFYESNSLMFYDSQGEVAQAVGERAAVVVGADLIAPIVSEMNVVDISSTQLTQASSFAELARLSDEYGYQYILTNGSNLSGQFKSFDDDPYQYWEEFFYSSTFDNQRYAYQLINPR